MSSYRTMPFITALLIVLTFRPVHSQEKSEKHPVPGEGELKVALKTIAELYKPEYEAAKTDEQRAKLAKKLLQVGLNSKDDLVGRFVLLRITKDIAASAGDAETSLSAIEEIDEHYKVDGLRLKGDILATIAKGLRFPKDHQELASWLEETVNDAIAQDRFDLAKSINATALESARKARSADLMKQVVTRTKEIKELEGEYQQVTEAVAKLQESPIDPKANLIVGNYQCFIKGDWKNGLPMLALSDDESLKKLAAIELVDTPDSLELGNAWWSYSEKVEGKSRSASRQRAAMWYKQTLPNLAGLSKELVESRLEEVGAKEVSISKAKNLREKYAPDAVQIGDHYYKFVWKDRISWPEAKAACESVGGRLACPDDNTRKALVIMKGKKVVWLGGYTNERGAPQGLDGELIPPNQLTSGTRKKLPARNMFVAFSVDDYFIVRPANGFDKNAPAKYAQGFICEWNE